MMLLLVLFYEEMFFFHLHPPIGKGNAVVKN